MKSALYHQETGEPKRFDVLAENEDGTVDLGKDGKLIVGKCSVVDAPKAGCATVEKPAEKAPEKHAGKHSK